MDKNQVRNNMQPKSKELEDNKSEIFSGYGQYSVVDELKINLPRTEILLERKSNNQFTYYRKNSENQISNKLIPRHDKDLKIELIPVLPLNLPAKKTHELIFLRLNNQILLSGKSNMEITVQFPIEIGIFVKSENSSDMIDVVTCEPMHSRFALYGAPETGKLCMYSKVSQIEEKDTDPYVWAKMKISIQNELDHGARIGKFVFALSGHQVYYKENTSEAHIDDLRARIYSDISGEIMEVARSELAKKEAWQLSPPSAMPPEPYIMKRGFD